jgi:hypothetical protein
LSINLYSTHGFYFPAIAEMNSYHKDCIYVLQSQEYLFSDFLQNNFLPPASQPSVLSLRPQVPGAETASPACSLSEFLIKT